ncbi:MAG TPA: hypothetical protein EYP14_00245, partial [Planctomycetaceae bacterium]|nr:hypothetical protein [Planctomycetaceae bacterium]
MSIEQFLRLERYPSPIYFSPFTDPLAEAAQDSLLRVLRRVLPFGVRVAISTKAVVPDSIFQLLSQWGDHVLFFVGGTSLDEDRNASVEPHCPPAGLRLQNVRRAREYGLTQLSARLDPLLPDVDDDPDRLCRLLDRAAEAGARQVTASYLFLTPLCNRDRLSRRP